MLKTVLNVAYKKQMTNIQDNFSFQKSCLLAGCSINENYFILSFIYNLKMACGQVMKAEIKQPTTFHLTNFCELEKKNYW